MARTTRGPDAPSARESADDQGVIVREAFAVASSAPPVPVIWTVMRSEDAVHEEKTR